MTYLASVTNWIAALGPFGIGAAGLFSGLAVWVAVPWGFNLRAKAQLRQVEKQAIERWKGQVEIINPLERDFIKKRIRIVDICSPISHFEIIGPANLVLDGWRMDSCTFRYDVVVMLRNPTITNGLWLKNCEFFECKIDNAPDTIKLRSRS